MRAGPFEKKDDATKDAFYAELDRAYGRCPSHDIKILHGDFNAKGEKEYLVPPSGNTVYMSPPRAKSETLIGLCRGAQHGSPKYWISTSQHP